MRVSPGIFGLTLGELEWKHLTRVAPGEHLGVLLPRAWMFDPEHLRLLIHHRSRITVLWELPEN
jgi:hypothetical protein